MPGIKYVLVIFSIHLFSVADSQASYPHLLHDFIQAKKAIADADRYAGSNSFNQNSADRLYLKALTLFYSLDKTLLISPNDSLSLLTFKELGYLYYYFDSIPKAKTNYLKAIRLQNSHHFVRDSSLFLSYIFTGSIYYRENLFDSAYHYFKIAESINDGFTIPLPESQRLYNWLGGMYYETGNYKQAKNYFEKAITLLKPTDPYAADLSIRYENNIASSLVKLEKYAPADSIYEILLSKGINTNELTNNRGIVNLKSGNYHKALQLFKSVKFENDFKITLFNHIGYTYAMLGSPDSAIQYYSKALQENTRWNGLKKNLKHGYTLQNIARLKESQGKLHESLQFYQKAITQFYPAYNQNNNYTNPDTFSGIFSYLDLFNLLIEKAEVFEKIYNLTDSIQDLDASLNAYAAAFKLVYYVEQMYDSDEARLFLNKIKYGVHDKPIQLSLTGFSKTHNKEYVSRAYLFDQQNKASILSYNVLEQSIKNRNKNINDLFTNEKKLKSNLTRLTLKANQNKDSITLENLINAIRDAEIALSKIQEQKNAFPQFKSLPQNIPQVTAIQNKLNANTAVISYHLSQNTLVAICISHTKIIHSITAIDSLFYRNVSTFKDALDPGFMPANYKGVEISQSLHQQLLDPIYSFINDKKALIIIPDDELNSLPFEVLQNRNGQYLIEKFIIHYQYSTSLLLPDGTKNIFLPVLALAPFANQSIGRYNQLKYSGQEIENLPGKILINQSATKASCLSFLNQYPVLHLATHTFIDEESPNSSHIAFSPINDSSDSKLFLPEIYNLPLDSTSLVILSACESAHGKLTKGEGMMSLSRAFYYAGCPNIIAALWKADDQSTSWILQKFYRYMRKGYSLSFSLRKAKIDYLNSPEIEKQFKAPYFWAHLVLTGELEVDNRAVTWENYMIVLVIVVIFIFAYKKLMSTMDR